MSKSLDHLEIDEIEVFIYISSSTFYVANVLRGLSDVHSEIDINYFKM